MTRGTWNIEQENYHPLPCSIHGAIIIFCTKTRPTIFHFICFYSSDALPSAGHRWDLKLTFARIPSLGACSIQKSCSWGERCWSETSLSKPVRQNTGTLCGHPSAGTALPQSTCKNVHSITKINVTKEKLSYARYTARIQKQILSGIFVAAIQGDAL